MKFNKFIIAIVGLFALAFTASAQIQNFASLPLLSGYNVLVPTNTTVGLGVTNSEFTTLDGKIVYSLTNREGKLWGDAFQKVGLSSDLNWDINANAAVYYVVGNTNYIPIAVTNGSVGGQSVSNWVLGTVGTGIIPGATTNLYPGLASGGTPNATNVYTFSLYRVFRVNPSTGDAGPRVFQAETTSFFSFAVTGGGTNVVSGVTNLPTAWTQGASAIYATVSCGPLINASQNGLVNQLALRQPQK